MNKQTNKTCDNGHRFFKSSDCPVCPYCEGKKKVPTGVLSVISAPARRALESKNISSAEQLARYSEKEIGALHGMGPKALALLKEELARQGLSFRS